MDESQYNPTAAELPPANFTFLVESLMMQTQMQLGIFSFGDEEEETAPNFDIAAHSIDLLAMLMEKTRGNLTPEEQRVLENGLTELRFRYVQAKQEFAKNQTLPIEKSEETLIISAEGGKGARTE